MWAILVQNSTNISIDKPQKSSTKKQYFRVLWEWCLLTHLKHMFKNTLWKHAILFAQNVGFLIVIPQNITFAIFSHIFLCLPNGLQLLISKFHPIEGNVFITCIQDKWWHAIMLQKLSKLKHRLTIQFALSAHSVAQVYCN